MPYLSVPGRRNDELSYVFSEPGIENGNTTISLFGIFHTQSTLPIYQTFIQHTVKNFLDFYHRSPDDIEHILGSKDVSPFEFIFEHSLQYTNEHLSKALQDLIEDEPKTSSLDLNKIHLILGAIMDGSLFLCTHGKVIRAYLLYPIKGSHPSTPYSLVDILQSATSTHDDPSKRLFSSIISGKISVPQSKLVICNQAFLDYVSLEQLKHSLTNQKTESLTQYFGHLLSKANAKNDFTAIFIDPWAIHIALDKKDQPETISHSSIENLLERQKGTSTVLKPAMVGNILSIASTFFDYAIKYTKHLLSRGITLLPAIRRFQKPKELVQIFVHWTASLIARLKNFIIQSFLPFSRREITRFFQYIGFLFDTKFRPLPPNSKALLIVCLLFVILFIQSLFSIADQRSTHKSEVYQRGLLSELEQNLNLAEASIIYESDDKTKELLQQANQMIGKIEGQQLANNELTTMLTKLKNRYNTIQAKKSRNVDIASPAIVATLDGSIPSPETIRFAGNTKPLILVNSDSVYTVDTKLGGIKQVNTQTKIASIPCAASFTDSLAYICSGSNRLFAYNTKQDSLQAVPYSDGGRSLTDLYIFNKRLYTLDGSKGVIARHDRKGAGFGDGSLWIRDGSLVQDAKSISIDGNVYVLMNGATINVYNAGQKTKTIPLPSLQNPITEITQLWTTDTTDYLYLLDNLEKRILVIDKRTYGYILSVTSPSFSQGIQDIIATKSDLLVISDGKLLSIPLEKIKL